MVVWWRDIIKKKRTLEKGQNDKNEEENKVKNEIK
jgi:hypothetical protein